MTRNDLKDYQWLLKNIEYLECEIQRNRDNIDIKSQQLSDMPKGGGYNDALAASIATIIDCQHHLNARIKEMVEKRIQIETAISYLPNREQMVLRYRYIDDREWHDICARMYISRTEVYRCHANALTMLKANIYQKCKI